MNTVYKYELESENLGDYIKINMPFDATIICVKEQFGKVCVWASVDTSQGMRERIFQVFATGQDQPQQMGISREYIGTVFFNAGGVVFHVYEVLN